jgi:peptidoglycan/xylan/chitin deacetylase (PgdA/CDA1 family)
MTLRTGAKDLYFRLSWLAGAQRRLLRSARSPERLHILNLHRVNPRPNPFWPPMHPRLFDELAGFLRRHFHVTTLRGLGDVEADRPSVVLSFDDGYQDFEEYAMPILHRHGIAANLNIVPECVVSGKPPWSVQLYDALAAAPYALVNGIRLPGFAGRLRGNSAETRERYGLELSRFLKNRPRAGRLELWRQLSEILNSVVPAASTRMMDEADVRAAAAIHEVGAHSYSHESMGLEADGFFADDFHRCAEYFRTVLSLPLSVYAFPNGSWRPGQPEFLLQRGIEYVLLVDEQIAARTARILPRLTVHGSTPAEVKLRALGYCARSPRSGISYAP